MKTKFNWEDPFFLSEQLTEDERAVQAAANAFCQEKLQPRVLMAARHEKFDREIMNEAGEWGLGQSVGESFFACPTLAFSLIVRPS